jgi:hypothetical protein
MSRQLLVVALLAGCSSPVSTPAATTHPLIRLDGEFNPTAGFPQLDLAPQIRCDGGAVLAATSHFYGGESSPVRAVMIDRAGIDLETFDLDDITEDLSKRDGATVQRKIDAANRKLAAQCWTPMTGVPEYLATWDPPTVTLVHGGSEIKIPRPDLVHTPAPDDDCVPFDSVGAVLIDDARHLGLVGIKHTMHDNCGDDPWSWVVVPLPTSPPTTTAFVCGQASQAVFETSVRAVKASSALGPCRVEVEGERKTVRRGSDTIYTDKEAGATWAYDPAFIVDGVHPGDDAGIAAKRAAEKGNTVVRCSAIDADVDECSFTPPGKDCPTGGMFLLLEHASAKTPLAGRAILAIALGMPC